MCSFDGRILNGNVVWKCSRCLVMVYCDKDCQRKHWSESHRDRCLGRMTEGPDVNVTFIDGLFDQDVPCENRRAMHM